MGVNGDGLECKDGKWRLILKGSEQEAVHNDSDVCLQCGAAEAQPRERQTGGGVEQGSGRGLCLQ